MGVGFVRTITKQWVEGAVCAETWFFAFPFWDRRSKRKVVRTSCGRMPPAPQSAMLGQQLADEYGLVHDLTDVVERATCQTTSSRHVSTPADIWDHKRSHEHSYAYSRVRTTNERRLEFGSSCDGSLHGARFRYKGINSDNIMRTMARFERGRKHGIRCNTLVSASIIAMVRGHMYGWSGWHHIDNGRSYAYGASHGIHDDSSHVTTALRYILWFRGIRVASH
jgi:hypothetical protein